MERLREEQARNPDRVGWRRRIWMPRDIQKHHLLHRLKSLHKRPMIAETSGIEGETSGEKASRTYVTKLGSISSRGISKQSMYD